MAKHAAKKHEQHSKVITSNYSVITYVIFVIFILYRVLWHYDSFGFFNWIGLFVFFGIYYFTLSLIFEALHINSGYDYYEDLLYITWCVQFLSMFSGYFWFIYLIVPIFIVYQWGGMVMNLCCPNTNQDNNGNEHKTRSQKKQERQQKIFGGRGNQN